jgi:hypothetical protein
MFFEPAKPLPNVNKYLEQSETAWQQYPSKRNKRLIA